MYKKRDLLSDYEWSWPDGKEPTSIDTPSLDKNPTNMANFESTTSLEDYESIILSKMKHKSAS